MQNTISIHTVLNIYNTTMDENGKQVEFNLSARYTTEKNKNFGKIYHKTRVVKHLSEKYRETNRPNSDKGAALVNKMLEENLLLFYDCNFKETFTVPFWAIIKFNGKKVIHG